MALGAAAVPNDTAPCQPCLAYHLLHMFLSLLCPAVLSTRLHGGVSISVLECSPSNAIDPALAAGISVAVSVVGVLLLAYCAYVSWYGRLGLPRLQRVSGE